MRRFARMKKKTTILEAVQILAPDYQFIHQAAERVQVGILPIASVQQHCTYRSHANLEKRELQDHGTFGSEVFKPATRRLRKSI